MYNIYPWHRLQNNIYVETRSFPLYPSTKTNLIKKLMVVLCFQVGSEVDTRSQFCDEKKCQRKFNTR